MDEDINQLFEEATSLKNSKPKRGHKRNTKTVKHINVRGGLEVAKDNYKTTKRIHKAQIKALRQNIKTHKLLIKQAHNTYKIIKLSK
jgi:hypothetical protein